LHEQAKQRVQADRGCDRHAFVRRPTIRAPLWPAIRATRQFSRVAGPTDCCPNANIRFTRGGVKLQHDRVCSRIGVVDYSGLNWRWIRPPPHPNSDSNNFPINTSRRRPAKTPDHRNCRQTLRRTRHRPRHRPLVRRGSAHHPRTRRTTRSGGIRRGQGSLGTAASQSPVRIGQGLRPRTPAGGSAPRPAFTFRASPG
jgi:hypothetical protein